MDCVHGNTIYTGASVVKNAYVVFDGAKLAGVSKAKKGTLRGEFDTVTPAFVDPHSHIGMHRAGEPESEGESNEHMEALLALPDALDSVQMDDAAFADAVEMGVLYSCVLPGSGNIIGGLTAVVRNYAADSTQALVARAGVKAAFGYNPMSTVEWKGKRPNTRMGALAILRGKLTEVRHKAAKRDRARGDRKLEHALNAEETVLAGILERKIVMRTHVHKIDDIAALLRIVDEFKLRITVEHSMDVHEPGIYRELARRKIPVTYGPIDAFAYKVELKHENWRNVKHLIDAGGVFGLMTDHPVTPSRQLFLQTRWFTRHGYTKQQAVELVTRRNAELLGLGKILGTLEKGKWASFTGWNGDPFDFTAYPTAVYGEGARVFGE